MKHITLSDRTKMQRMGYKVRVWYEIIRSGVPFHQDYTSLEAAEEFNTKVRAEGKVRILAMEQI